MKIAPYTRWRWSATLGKFLPVANRDRPPWAEPYFSYTFSGLPPVEVYFTHGYA